MSKAILSPGACTQVSFSCEELWNSLFTIGALCFPFPNLKCLWNALFWLEEGCVHSPGNVSPYPLWPAGGHRAPVGHLLPTLLHNSWPWQFERGAGWEANRHLPVTAALGVLTAHHIFWFLLLFLPPPSENITQKGIYFIFIFCEKIKQSTLTV